MTDPSAPAAAAPPHPIPWHRRAEMAAAQTVGAADVRQHRADAAANDMLRRGADPAKVKEAMAEVPGWKPDDRSAEQVRHDREHGVEQRRDPKSFAYQLPSSGLGDGFDAGNVAKLDADVRAVAAGLQLDVARGSAFVRSVVDTIAAANRLDPEGRAAAAEKSEAQLKAILKENYPAAVKAVAGLVDGMKIANKQFAAAFKANGLLATPSLFLQLYHRSQALAQWRNARPK